ncbi:hypothetical protein ACFV9G_27755 [Nocardioides sp. NPDC059952]|uniref:hypothetical protein n=1 Tax=Nocardioides sp. NPDC059952 TaxID=3347014 RepID=UPI003649986F
MDDRELDGLLNAAAPRLGDGEAALARELATAVARGAGVGDQMLPRQRRRRRPYVIGGVAIGALVLSAAMTQDAWMMSVPPHMTIESGGQRLYEPIEFVATWGSGEQRTCQLFLEFRDLDEGEMEEVAAYVRTKDWSAWNDDLSDAATDDSPGLEDRFRAELKGVVPELGEPVDDAPRLTGYGTSCEAGE